MQGGESLLQRTRHSLAVSLIHDNLQPLESRGRELLPDCVCGRAENENELVQSSARMFSTVSPNTVLSPRRSNCFGSPMRVDLPAAKMMAPTRELSLPVIEIIEVFFLPLAGEKSGYQKFADCDSERKSIHNTLDLVSGDARIVDDASRVSQGDPKHVSSQSPGVVPNLEDRIPVIEVALISAFIVIG